MNNKLKWALVILGALLLLAFIGFQWMKHNTKRHSPEATIEFAGDGNEITINYCRPYKKDRKIFGGLVPYGEVWRTGANEATTFTTTADLIIDGELLPAGEYTLWTIPADTHWEIIFNSELYGWGVGFDQKASRIAKYDVLKAMAPVVSTDGVQEQFTIRLNTSDDVDMVFEWDQVSVTLPMSWAE